jgi:enamine deaminase RidA (YjgF/YER057c/UK114 family)
MLLALTWTKDPVCCCAGQRAALENLERVLKAAGSGLEHIVKANIYLSNLPRDFSSMNEVYIEVCRRALTWDTYWQAS